ncbi:MAG: hypothetical protein N4A50_00530 [Vallitalea sp.]|jgi:flagellar basal-body rod modification protein FlgD|nr:hypothetical protein [Vallitalea sp.]
MANVSPTDVINELKEKYGTKPKGKASNNLDKDTFLNLLVTQMRYQDPLNPTQDKEFLAQMAQFTALEQMKNLNTSAQMSRAYSLMDKSIFAQVVNPVSLEVTPVAGRVTGVLIKNGEVFLKVGKVDVPLEKVEGVIPSDDIYKISQKVDKISEDLEKIKEKYIPKDSDDKDKDKDKDNSDDKKVSDGE